MTLNALTSPATAPSIPASMIAGPQIVDCAARPFAYIVRFCSTEESSIAAAIRQAVATLDNFLAQHGSAAAQELIVIYRKRIPAAVTLHVGFPVPLAVADIAAGEILSGTTPSGPMVPLIPGGNLCDVLGAGAELPEGGESFSWQSFRSADFRPWHQHPSAPPMAPAGLVPVAASVHPR